MVAGGVRFVYGCFSLEKVRKADWGGREKGSSRYTSVLSRLVNCFSLGQSFSVSLSPRFYRPSFLLVMLSRLLFLLALISHASSLSPCRPVSLFPHLLSFYSSFVVSILYFMLPALAMSTQFSLFSFFLYHVLVVAHTHVVCRSHHVFCSCIILLSASHHRRIVAASLYLYGF